MLVEEHKISPDSHDSHDSNLVLRIRNSVSIQTKTIYYSQKLDVDTHNQTSFSVRTYIHKKKEKRIKE